jgi:hypothetical protein
MITKFLPFLLISCFSIQSFASTRTTTAQPTELVCVREGNGSITLANAEVDPRSTFLPLPSKEEYSRFFKDFGTSLDNDRRCRRQAEEIQGLIRVDYTSPYDPAIVSSWNPSSFTNPSTLHQGDRTMNWQFVVHGLELGYLEASIADMSMDTFGISYLHVAPSFSDDSFIPHYPRTFLSTPLTATSVVCGNNAATFGRFGFTLRVPQENVVASCIVDMHTPTAKDFYRGHAGLVGTARILDEYKLSPLQSYLPTEPRPLQNGTCGTGCSYYNEVAIAPLIRSGSHVEITGVFYRSAKPWQEALGGNTARAMNQIAEQYNLPIMQILNDFWFQTNV